MAREFVWGDANRFPEPLAMIDNTPVGGEMPGRLETFSYLHDALGSVVALTDNVGRLVERYTYDPYGRVVVERPDDPDGPADANPCETGCAPVQWKANICGDDEVLTANSLTYSAYGNPFMWTGQRYDAVTGTYQFHYRTYSPGLGRWLQRDPAGYVDGVNLYTHVQNNPIRLADPLGLDSKVLEVRPVPPPAPPTPMAPSTTPIVTEVGGQLVRCVSIGLGAAITVLCTTEPIGVDKDGRPRDTVPTPEEKEYWRKYDQQQTSLCKKIWNNYKKACGQKRSCKGLKDCNEILDRLRNGRLCVAGRRLYIDLGCDNWIPTEADHPGELKNAQQVLETCEQAAIDNNCYNQPSSSTSAQQNSFDGRCRE